MSEVVPRKSPDEIFEVERDGEPDLVFTGRSLARLEYPNGSSIELFETGKGLFVVATVDTDQYGNEEHSAAVLDDLDSLVAWFDRRYGPMSRVFKHLARRCVVVRPDIFKRAVEIIQ